MDVRVGTLNINRRIAYWAKIDVKYINDAFNWCTERMGEPNPDQEDAWFFIGSFCFRREEDRTAFLVYLSGQKG